MTTAKLKLMNDRYSLLAAMFNVFGTKYPLLRLRLRPSHTPKPRATITAVVSRCPGGRHYWCESNVGLIRKSANSIPAHLLREIL